MKGRSKAEWRSLFEQHETSGLKAVAFCREHDLCPKYFSLRRRQLEMEASKPVSGFVPVVTPPAQRQTITLQWDHRLTLQLPSTNVHVSGALRDKIQPVRVDICTTIPVNCKSTPQPRSLKIL